MSEWSTLEELSTQYMEAAAPLRDRLAALRRELAATDDPEEVWSIKRRIHELTPLLTEMYAMAKLTDNYYDPGHYRNEKYTCNGMKAVYPPGVKRPKENAATVRDVHALEDLFMEEPDPDELRAQKVKALLEFAQEGLPEKQADVFHACILEAQTQTDYARERGVHKTTAYRLLNAALEKVQKKATVLGLVEGARILEKPAQDLTPEQKVEAPQKFMQGESSRTACGVDPRRAKLTGAQAEVFRACILEGRTLAEFAREKGVHQTSARITLNRARAKVREEAIRLGLLEGE